MDIISLKYVDLDGLILELEVQDINKPRLSSVCRTFMFDLRGCKVLFISSRHVYLTVRLICLIHVFLLFLGVG